jgi:hypothetical protein
MAKEGQRKLGDLKAALNSAALIPRPAVTGVQQLQQRKQFLEVVLSLETRWGWGQDRSK